MESFKIFLFRNISIQVIHVEMMVIFSIWRMYTFLNLTFFDFLMRYLILAADKNMRYNW